MLRVSTFHTEIIKFHYFALKEGIVGEREGDFTDNFNMHLFFLSLSTLSLSLFLKHWHHTGVISISFFVENLCHFVKCPLRKT
jgi:hypothetical protein